MDHQQANIYTHTHTKKPVHTVQYSNINLYGITFTFINSLYNYYQLLRVLLSVVSCAEILCCEYCECISKIFPFIGNLKLLKIIKIINSFKILSIMC